MIHMQLRASHLRAVLAGAALVIAAAGSAVGLPVAQAATVTLKGTAVAGNALDFTVVQPGRSAGRINQMISYANRLAAHHYRYVFGGGHQHVQVASRGSSPPHAVGFDCSATVAAVLAAADLWPKSQSVPGDTGVIQDLLARHEISRGAGSGPYQVDIYDRPGSDIQMSIDGDEFGTGYTPAGGPAWMGANPADFHGYKTYHVLPSVLKDSSSYKHYVTFRYTAGPAGIQIAKDLSNGTVARITYRQSDGKLIALRATYLGGVPFPGGSPGAGQKPTTTAGG